MKFLSAHLNEGMVSTSQQKMRNATTIIGLTTMAVLQTVRRKMDTPST